MGPMFGLASRAMVDLNVPVESRARRTLAHFADGVAAMQRCHEGDTLRAHAGNLIRQLPPGPVDLVATTLEGAGLAAAVAALRGEPTRWRQVRLTIPQDWTDEVVFVVEPLELSAALKRSLRRRLPRAQFLWTAV